MGRVPTREARQRAADRIIEVVRNNYASELSDLQSQSEVEADLPLPAPQDDDIYQSILSPEDTISNSKVALMLEDAGSRVERTQGSSNGMRNREDRDLEIKTVFMFRTMPHQPIQRHGRQLDEMTVMKRRGNRYVGAMDETIRKYAPKSDFIHDVELIEDIVGTFEFEEEQTGTVGFAGATFEIFQRTSAPIG